MTELKTYSNLMKAIRSGEFVISGELEPERTSNIEPTVHEALEIKKYCVAANITDNPKSTVCLSSLAGSYLLKKNLVWKLCINLHVEIRIVWDWEQQFSGPFSWIKEYPRSYWRS